MPPASCRLRPFYSDDGLAAISGFLTDAGALAGGQAAEVVCALVSLGDLIYEMDSARPAA